MTLNLSFRMLTQMWTANSRHCEYCFLSTFTRVLSKRALLIQPQQGNLHKNIVIVIEAKRKPIIRLIPTLVRTARFITAHTEKCFVYSNILPLRSFTVHSYRNVCSPLRNNMNEIKNQPVTDPPKRHSSNADDICGSLHKEIAYTDDNIIALNKPYGLSVYGFSAKPSEGGQDLSSSGQISLVSILPKLGSKLKCKELEIGLSLKSFYSGVVLLSRHKKSKTALEKVLAGSQIEKSQYLTYLAITLGVPQCPHGTNLTANIKRERLHNREMSTVSDTRIQNACKAGLMIQTCFSVVPLVVNESVGAALVQITLSKDKWEAVEVLMSHYLSPVLGDHIYSSRTQIVAGVPFAASPNAAFPQEQRIPSTVLELLQQNTDSVKQPVPLFVHRYKVVLKRFPSKLSPQLVITAPPQKEFLTTLQSLGLYQEGMFS